jgi:hypothetical protein
VRLRVRIGGGDGTGLVILGDVDLEPSYGSLVDIPERDRGHPDRGSGELHHPDAHRHGHRVDRRGRYRRGVVGPERYGGHGDAGRLGHRGQLLVEDDHRPHRQYQYTYYLTVDTSDVGPEPFLEAVGGDTDTATDGDGEELVARAVSDGSGHQVIHWGVQDAAGAAASTGSDTLQYASQAAAIAAGWTVTDTMPSGPVTFNTGHAIAGSGLSKSIAGSARPDSAAPGRPSGWSGRTTSAPGPR